MPRPSGSNPGKSSKRQRISQELRVVVLPTAHETDNRNACLFETVMRSLYYQLGSNGNPWAHPRPTLQDQLRLRRHVADFIRNSPDLIQALYVQIQDLPTEDWLTRVPEGRDRTDHEFIEGELQARLREIAEHGQQVDSLTVYATAMATGARLVVLNAETDAVGRMFHTMSHGFVRRYTESNNFPGLSDLAKQLDQSLPVYIHYHAAPDFGDALGPSGIRWGHFQPIQTPRERQRGPEGRRIVADTLTDSDTGMRRSIKIVHQLEQDPVSEGDVDYDYNEAPDPREPVDATDNATSSTTELLPAPTPEPVPPPGYVAKDKEYWRKRRAEREAEESAKVPRTDEIEPFEYVQRREARQLIRGEANSMYRELHQQGPPLPWWHYMDTYDDTPDGWLKAAATLDATRGAGTWDKRHLNHLIKGQASMSEVMRKLVDDEITNPTPRAAAPSPAPEPEPVPPPVYDEPPSPPVSIASSVSPLPPPPARSPLALPAPRTPSAVVPFNPPTPAQSFRVREPSPYSITLPERHGTTHGISNRQFEALLQSVQQKLAGMWNLPSVNSISRDTIIRTLRDQFPRLDIRTLMRIHGNLNQMTAPMQEYLRNRVAGLHENRAEEATRLLGKTLEAATLTTQDGVRLLQRAMGGFQDSVLLATDGYLDGYEQVRRGAVEMANDVGTALGDVTRSTVGGVSQVMGATTRVLGEMGRGFMGAYNRTPEAPAPAPKPAASPPARRDTPPPVDVPSPVGFYPGDIDVITRAEEEAERTDTPQPSPPPAPATEASPFVDPDAQLRARFEALRTPTRNPPATEDEEARRVAAQAAVAQQQAEAERERKRKEDEAFERMALNMAKKDRERREKSLTTPPTPDPVADTSSSPPPGPAPVAASPFFEAEEEVLREATPATRPGPQHNPLLELRYDAPGTPSSSGDVVEIASVSSGRVDELLPDPGSRNLVARILTAGNTAAPKPKAGAAAKPKPPPKRTNLYADMGGLSHRTFYGREPHTAGNAIPTRQPVFTGNMKKGAVRGSYANPHLTTPVQRRAHRDELRPYVADKDQWGTGTSDEMTKANVYPLNTYGVSRRLPKVAGDGNRGRPGSLDRKVRARDRKGADSIHDDDIVIYTRKGQPIKGDKKNLPQATTWRDFVDNIQHNSEATGRPMYNHHVLRGRRFDAEWFANHPRSDDFPNGYMPMDRARRLEHVYARGVSSRIHAERLFQLKKKKELTDAAAAEMLAAGADSDTDAEETGDDPHTTAGGAAAVSPYRAPDSNDWSIPASTPASSLMAGFTPPPGTVRHVGPVDLLPAPPPQRTPGRSLPIEEPTTFRTRGSEPPPVGGTTGGTPVQAVVVRGEADDHVGRPPPEYVNPGEARLDRVFTPIRQAHQRAGTLRQIERIRSPPRETWAAAMARLEVQERVRRGEDPRQAVRDWEKANDRQRANEHRTNP